jgi:hypothetical protein
MVTADNKIIMILLIVYLEANIVRIALPGDGGEGVLIDQGHGMNQLLEIVGVMRIVQTEIGDRETAEIIRKWMGSNLPAEMDQHQKTNFVFVLKGQRTG